MAWIHVIRHHYHDSKYSVLMMLSMRHLQRLNIIRRHLQPCSTRSAGTNADYQRSISEDFSTSPSRFHASPKCNKGRVHCDGGIHILTGTNTALNKWTDLACGYGFTVLCCEHQQLLVSGLNFSSQLGVPSAQQNIVDKLAKVKLPFTKSNSRILDISCGRLHTVVSTTEGLFAAGCNTLGQCGLGKDKEITNFTKVPWSSSIPVKQVTCGLDHTLLLTVNGDVWSCGWGVDGQTGNSPLATKTQSLEAGQQPTRCTTRNTGSQWLAFPNRYVFNIEGRTDEQGTFDLVQLPSNVKIKKVAAKSDSCLALSNCGEVFSWGNSEYNQLGFSTEETLITKPTKIPGLQNVVDVAIGNSMGLAVTDDNEVFTWGYGLLDNSFEPCFSSTPQKLVFHAGKRVMKVECGLDYYVLVTDDEEVYIWGRLNRALYSSVPKKVALPTNMHRYSCGIDHMGIIVDE